ncbi:S-adenosylmethionine:tRNA ribosyltransferase-isomerase [Dirofilaria immitis]
MHPYGLDSMHPEAIIMYACDGTDQRMEREEQEYGDADEKRTSGMKKVRNARPFLQLPLAWTSLRLNSCGAGQTSRFVYRFAIVRKCNNHHYLPTSILTAQLSSILAISSDVYAYIQIQLTSSISCASYKLAHINCFSPLSLDYLQQIRK